MKCQLCGNELPDDSTSCSTCGLDFESGERFEPHSGEKMENHQYDDNCMNNTGGEEDSVFTPGGEFPPGVGYSQEAGVPPGGIYQPGSGYPPGGGFPPQGSQPGWPGQGDQQPYYPREQYPGQAQQDYQQQGAPGDVFSQPPGGWSPPPGTAPRQAVKPVNPKRTVYIVLAAILVFAILAVSGSVFAYYEFLKPKAENPAITSMLEQYFNTLGSGNTDGLDNYYTANSSLPEDQLFAIKAVYSLINMQFGNLEIEIVSDDGNNAVVKVRDFDVTMSAQGTNQKIRFSELVKQAGGKFEPTEIKLVRESGTWKLADSIVVDPFGGMSVTSTGSS